MAKVANPKTPECPSCHTHQARYRSSTRTYICRVCGHEWARPEPEKAKG
jgi:ribosomal protein L37AE/L43A